MFGASDNTYPYAYAYLVIYLAGTTFSMIATGMNSFINSQGFARTGMLTVMIGAVLNVVFDLLFIFTLGWGVQGAAVATVLSQMVSCVWVLRFLTGKRAILTLKWQSMLPEPKLLRQIISLGFSGFIMSATNCLVQVACNATLKIHGEICMWALIMTQPGFLFSLFCEEQAMIEAGVDAMRLYFFGFFLISLQSVGQSVFVSLGKAKHAICFSLQRKAVIVFSLTLLLPNVAGLGVNGVFLAEPISDLIGGVACYVTMLLTVWPALNRK